MNLPSGKLMALVAVFAAIGVITGTGAFTTVSAERTANVNVAGDGSALLGLSASNSDYADVGSDGTLTINMAGSFGNSGNAAGLNLNARTTVAQMFTITNNGQNEVGVNMTVQDITSEATPEANEDSDDTDHSGAVAFVVPKSEIKQPNTGSLPSTDVTIGNKGYYYLSNTKDIDLESGESIQVGMVVDTRDGNAYDDDGSSGTGSESAITDKKEDLLDQITIKAEKGYADDDDATSTGGTPPDFEASN